MRWLAHAQVVLDLQYSHFTHVHSGDLRGFYLRILGSTMDDGRGKQLHIYAENKIQVQDHGRSATPFPRPLSQYLSTDISTRLLNSSAPRTQAVIDQEILSVNEIIESLQALRIIKSQIRNVCAPISRLPPEILAEIFIACLDRDNSQSSDNGSESDKLDLRLTLGQVCSSWRSVAWGLPMLWTTIHCRILHPNRSKKLADLLFQWLLRAQTLSISVTIDFEDEETWSKLGVDAPIDILDVITPFYHQINVLDLALPASWENHLRTFDSLPLDSLEELRIRPTVPYRYREVDIRAFSAPPNLRSLSSQSYLLQHLYLPWQNLIRAEFGGPSLDEIIELLSRCTSLAVCHISNPVPDDQIYPISPIVHTRLEELCIKFSQVDPAPPGATHSDILGLLTLPCLRGLSLKLPFHHASPFHDISQLIGRSQCHLKAVEISGHALDNNQVVDFLPETTVVHLYNA